jgi:hypothetical protein
MWLFFWAGNHIPPKRAGHLVYFNPGDIEFPIGMNVIGSVLPDDRHLVASGIISGFKGIWRDSWGPRLEYILYNAVSALLECRNQTLLGVNRLLTDDVYRAKVIHVPRIAPRPSVKIRKRGSDGLK